MKNTLLLVFIHGFKGSDTTFKTFPRDLRNGLSKELPKVDVVTVQYPQFDTRGDLGECVWKFKEWLQNKILDLEALNKTPSPKHEPSVHCILLGHSMGGIVAAETLLSFVRDDEVPITPDDSTEGIRQALIHVSKQGGSTLPDDHATRVFFPYIRAILCFDTPFLGVSPGVLAFGAEDKWSQASTAYQAFTGANEMFGWNSRTSSPQPASNVTGKGVASKGKKSGGWGSWAKAAAYGSAAAAVAGTAYLKWNQISEGLSWVGSHLEFVQCLTRGAELKERVESLVRLTETHGLGFADFYSSLGQHITSKSQYTGSVLGTQRTFCVIPRSLSSTSSGGLKRNPPSEDASSFRDGEERPRLEDEMKDSDKIRDYVKDTSKSKGRWVRCTNEAATDEITAHRSMFIPQQNPGYRTFMLPESKKQILAWIDREWYESSGAQVTNELNDGEMMDVGHSDAESFELD